MSLSKIRDRYTLNGALKKQKEGAFQIVGVPHCGNVPVFIPGPEFSGIKTIEIVPSKHRKKTKRK